MNGSNASGATILPRADSMGVVPGFDPHVPGVVNVVTLSQAGKSSSPVTLDLSAISLGDMRQAIATTEDPLSVYETLSKIQQSSNRPARSVPSQAYDYNYQTEQVVPTKEMSEMQHNFGSPRQVSGPLEMPVRQFVDRGEGQPRPQPAFPPSNGMQELYGVVQQLADRVSHLTEQMYGAQNGGYGKKTLDEHRGVATPEQANAIETLAIPFVDGSGTGRKPSTAVVFEFAGFGRQLTYYHQVIDQGPCLVLVYDTRYEGGMQYMPPERPEIHIEVHVPTLNKSYTVSSMGLSYSCGVLDFVVLIKSGEDEALQLHSTEKGVSDGETRRH